MELRFQTWIEFSDSLKDAFEALMIMKEYLWRWNEIIDEVLVGKNLILFSLNEHFWIKHSKSFNFYWIFLKRLLEKIYFSIVFFYQMIILSKYWINFIHDEGKNFFPQNTLFQAVQAFKTKSLKILIRIVNSILSKNISIVNILFGLRNKH